MRYYLNCHIIRPSAPSNMNRGDDGKPKCYYTASGARRSYVSSQCLNHAYREAWRRDGDFNNPSIRTKAVKRELMKAVAVADPSMTEEERSHAVEVVLGLLGIKCDGKDFEKTKNAVFMSRHQYRALAEVIRKHKDLLLAEQVAEEEDGTESAEGENDDGQKKKKKKSKKSPAAAVLPELADAINKNIGPEMFLKGAFLPKNTLLTVQACWQTAAMTAINDYKPTSDFYSSTDDVLDENGYLDVQEMSQNLFYEYNVLNLSELSKGIGTEMAAEVAVKAMEKVMTTLPDGMQNRFASYDMPVTALFTIRERQANLQSAFWAPTKAEDIIADSVRRLGDEARRMYDSYLEPPVKAYVIGKSVDLGAVEPETGRMADVLASMKKEIISLLGE